MAGHVFGEDRDQEIGELIEILAEHGRRIMEEERLGLGSFESLSEARSEVDAIQEVLSERTREGIHRSKTGGVDEAYIRRTGDEMAAVSPKIRRLLAPANAHYLPNLSLGVIPFLIEQLAPVLAASSRAGGLDPDLAGRLLLLAEEFEFFAVLLGLATDRPLEDKSEAQTALDRIREELDSLSNAEDTSGADIAVLRKRLNDALDQVENHEAAADQVLSQISETAEQIEALRGSLDHLVALARERGASWNKIAKAVGISPQSAHKRWDPEARAKAQQYMRDYAARKRE
jgi:hypothetical protein